MSRAEHSYKRDMTFHVNRRSFGRNIPATDLDFIEFDNLEPVLIWEAKSDKSKWKDGRRTASMIVQWKIAKRANIKYRVVENNEDWSVIKVYKIIEWNRMVPKTQLTNTFTLPEFITALYKIRGRKMPNMKIPERLEPITFGLLQP